MTQASRIRALVLDFYNNRMAGSTQDFTANDLRAVVNAGLNTPAAPGSSDRILRMLRQGGLLNYIVLNRAQSLYRFTPTALSVPTSVPDATGDSNVNG